MRIWIYGIISLLMVTYVIGDPAADVLGYDNSGSNIFALTPDCKLVISKLSKFESSVNEANRGTKSHDCDNGELLHFYSGTDTSNLMVFVPTQVDPKKETKIYKGMKVYGTKLIDESAGNVTDLNHEFEIIDYNYVLPPKCGFDPKNFKVGLDVNVIFMLVTCENHLAFLRTQINFQKSMVFTPKTWMVHFEPSVQSLLTTSRSTPSCVANKLAFVPYNGDASLSAAGDSSAASDSYILRYCDKLIDDGRFIFYATELHNINAPFDTATIVKIPLLDTPFPAEKNLTNLSFMTSQVYVMKFHDSLFYMGVADDRYSSNPSVYMHKLNSFNWDQQSYKFNKPVVAIGREYLRMGQNVEPNVTGDWIFRTKQNPDFQPSMDVAPSCNKDTEKGKIDTCEKDIEDAKDWNLFLYILIGCEVVMILITIGIFIFCLVTQHRRRRVHREKKVRKYGPKHGQHGKHGRHGKKKAKKDEADMESDKDGGATTGKSTERTSKTSKKDATDNNNETVDGKTTSYYTVPSQMQVDNKKTE